MPPFLKTDLIAALSQDGLNHNIKVAFRVFHQKVDLHVKIQKKNRMKLARHHAVSPCLVIMLFHPASSPFHVILSRGHPVSPSHVILPRHHPVSPSRVTLPRHHAHVRSCTKTH